MSVIINGKTYNWGSISISLAPLSQDLYSVSSISFSESQRADAVYGKGNKPIAYGSGNWSANGSMRMLKTEFNQLMSASPNGILNLDPRNTVINIIYADPNGDDNKPYTISLTGVRFTDIKEDAKQGDSQLSVDLSFSIFGSIERN